MKLEELVSETKKRHVVFTRMGKPITWFSGSVSTALTVYTFAKNNAEFTPALFGLIALTFILFYYATSVPAIKLFLRRTLALFIDFFLIGVALFASVSWYQASIEPSGDILQIQLGRVLMIALWLIFLYFVFFDWRFKGTVGKRFVGLTVTTEGKSRISFCGSFIRTFLSLPLPIIIVAHLGYWIVDGSHSTVRTFINDFCKNLVVSFVPLSILFFEGNQSIADRLTRVVVRAEHESTNLLAKIERRRWIKLCSFNLGWALLFAILYLPVWKHWFKEPSQPPPGFTSTWGVSDPQGIATLWMLLPIGMKEPMFGIRNIDLLNASPNPFTFQADRTHFNGLLTLDFNKSQVMPIVRVTLTRDHPLQVKLLVVRNFMNLVSEKTPIERRPSFSVLQFATESDFGLFEIDREENILLCFMTSGKNAMDFYTDIRPQDSIRLTVSLDRTGFELVGAGIPYRE